jgi:hypothetical protein
MHLRVADAIEKTSPGALSDNAAAIVHHLCRAGALIEGQRLLLHLEAAGKSALEACAYEEALNEASRLGDRSLMAHGAGDRYQLKADFFRLPEALTDGIQNGRLGGSDGPP